MVFVARSKRSLLSSSLVIALSIVACAQVTGLSDDYKFDLDAAADGGEGGTSGGDGATPFVDGGKCSASDQSTASTDIRNANGDKVPLLCRTCLVANCCTPIHLCAGLNVCRDSMRCIFNCQDKVQQNEKATCLRQCDDTAFNTAVGTCVTQDCQQACDLKSR